MRSGGASNIGSGQWEIVVDNDENDGGGTEEQTIVEREYVTGENGEGGQAMEEEEEESTVMAFNDGRGDPVVVAGASVFDVEEVENVQPPVEE